MKKYILILSLFISLAASAQKVLNDYKYVIVPVRYDFLQGDNKFRLNTITKFNLTKIGFLAFYENENLPQEAGGDRCNKLFVDVEKENSLLATKLVIVFKDCNNKVVYKTEAGKSTVKEYEVAYPEALEKAFGQLYNYGYKYKGPAIATNTASTSTAPKSSAAPEDAADMLFAQPIPNGYQLIDKTPKVVLKIFKTSQPDYFTAQSETINGAVIKKNGEWILEYYKDEKLVSEKLLIKF
ncbi:hypothetical protein CLV94_2547 [Flavobacterium endophyticum]|uniref:Uncharacterized protein n=1 Tax=Flavobacterium endophyticum TaxID=1540163 RepID=A0A495M9U4_9FLAO|nr:hypothetical protein [Flavobacterium endophyticum]RKS21912.1 hypothetical protein CLV94_2547 [Flavobacterium endophyticum]